MAVIHEIHGIIWLNTPKGKAMAKFLIDYGPEADLQWVCFQQSGEIWTWGNQDIRVDDNITVGRKAKA